MTRTMYDSITAADIPASATLVAGYIDLSSRWSAADWDRFPNATKVQIARGAHTNDGHVLDVERFLATPDQAPEWVKMRRAAGADPTVYCNDSALAAVRAAFDAAGVVRPHFWTAHYDNAPTVPAGCVAKQYINDPASGGHYDLSAVADYWPGVDPTPNPTPTSGPVFGEDYEMQPIELPPVPVAANGSQVAYEPIQWDGRAAQLNIEALDDGKPVFVHQLANWGNKGGTGGGVPAPGTNPPGAGANAWRVDPNLPVSFTIPAGTLRTFFSYSCNGRTSVQIVPTAA